MPRLVVDAGPLIALFHRQDAQHHHCFSTFQTLLDQQYDLLTTFPVLCEVHKLIQQYANPSVAQKALIELGEALEVIPLNKPEMEAVFSLVANTSGWRGTLQDASVIVLAQQLELLVWTLDFRDFSRFPDLMLL